MKKTRKLLDICLKKGYGKLFVFSYKDVCRNDGAQNLVTIFVQGKNGFLFHMSGKENILYAGSNTSECYSSFFSIEGIYPDGLKRRSKGLNFDLSEANKAL